MHVRAYNVILNIYTHKSSRSDSLRTSKHVRVQSTRTCILLVVSIKSNTSFQKTNIIDSDTYKMFELFLLAKQTFAIIKEYTCMNCHTSSLRNDNEKVCFRVEERFKHLVCLTLMITLVALHKSCLCEHVLVYMYVHVKALKLKCDV